MNAANVSLIVHIRSCTNKPKAAVSQTNQTGSTATEFPIMQFVKCEGSNEDFRFLKEFLQTGSTANESPMMQSVKGLEKRGRPQMTHEFPTMQFVKGRE